jgi:hypothetical protein
VASGLRLVQSAAESPAVRQSLCQYRRGRAETPDWIADRASILVELVGEPWCCVVPVGVFNVNRTFLGHFREFLHALQRFLFQRAENW